jgi:Flp pilus assembly protein TadG
MPPQRSAQTMARQAGGDLRQTLRRAPAAEGQALVEFSLMIMLLLAVVFGIVDFGAALYDQTMLASAATDGARSGAIAGGSTSTAQAAAQSAVNNAIGCTPSASATTTGGTPAQIQVTVSCSYSGITPLGSLIGLIFPHITAQSSAKVEQ